MKTEAEIRDRIKMLDTLIAMNQHDKSYQESLTHEKFILIWVLSQQEFVIDAVWEWENPTKGTVNSENHED